MTPKRIRTLTLFTAAILASATTTVLSQPLIHGDITKCKDFVCRATCEQSPWVHGVCIDGNQYLQISIECCCCVPGSSSRKFYGG